MATPDCPNCHGTTTLAAKCPYCPHCGWNRDAALTSLRRGMRVIPVGLLAFVGAMAAVIVATSQAHTRGSFNPAFLFPFFSITPIAFIIAYVALRRKVSELSALPSPAMMAGRAVAMGGPSGFANASMGDATAMEPSAQVQALLRTPKPRQVRMATRGKINIAAVAVGVLIFEAVIDVPLYQMWIQTHSFARLNTASWVMVGFGVLLWYVPISMWRAQVKECGLLENGEIALAKVVHQWSGDKSTATIEYVFKDLRGEMQKRTGFDYTRTVTEGMTIAVFYDSENPKQQIPYCGSFHEVVL